MRSNPGTVRNARQPDHRNNPPGGLGERLKEVTKQRRRLASFVVARAMDLVKIEFFGETTEPDLREEGSVQVEELVLLVVQIIVCILAQVLRARHSGSGVDGAIGVSVDFTIGQLCVSVAVGLSVGVSIYSLFRDEKSDKVLIENLVGRVRVCMRIRIFEDLFDVAAGVFENIFGTARMILNKIGDIVDLVADGDISGVTRVMRFHLSASESW